MSCVLILEVMHRNKLYKKITMALITLVHVPGGYSLIPVCEYHRYPSISIDRTYSTTSCTGKVGENGQIR